VPYELLTGDLSQVNYSSIRAGLVEFRRMIDAVQWQLFVPMFCAPVWRWFAQAAWAAGRIPEPMVRVEWSPPEFETVDPQKWDGRLPGLEAGGGGLRWTLTGRRHQSAQVEE